ncbi:TetR/AcrR family transcriptional regulator [Sphaerisporangium sp. NPDC005289]|uniref:TetR/AcrR family transcriptional regulator n=1 Tax=Sphaerisporangium sp. NPDC005289 TaxID=3155247 RepID=UPI0033A329C1
MSRHPASPNPTGLARRNRRLSDQETRDRMLRAAIEMINRTGLTVSLDHISFEEVVRDAGVSRSTAYRHWPYKDLFLSDLVKELARTTDPAIVHDEVQLVRQILAQHPDRLDTPESRYGLILELIRRLALLDFQSVLTSPRWRTYFALHATFPSLTDDDLREQVRDALARSEAAHTAQVALAWRQLTGLFGYRLRPELATSYEALATLLSATMRGLVITALSTPEIATYQAVARPPGAAGADQWSLPAIGFVAIATTFIEPDPAARWDDRRLAEIHKTLDEWQVTGP